MADYIDREVAKGSLRMNQHRFTCADEANGFGSVKWSEDVIYANAAQKAIDTIPSADVQPVRKARWKCESIGCYYCSLCNEQSLVRTKFCGNCGADMRSNAQVMPSKEGGT